MTAPKLPSILSKKYPAKAHARRVVEYIASKGNASVKQGVLYLESGKSRMNEDNDQESPFRQRRNFFYMTGCELADSAVVYDVAQDKMTLFVPPVVDDEVVWSGLPVQKDDGLKKYDVDDVLTTDQVNHFLSGPATPKTAVYAIANRVSDEALFLAFKHKDMESLKEALDECRVIKDEYELALMRYANDASKVAHVAVMKAAPKAKSESELEGLFLQNCFAAGCRKQAYDSIVAAGTDASTLHYVHNNKMLDGHLNILLDAGGEYRCYAADITRTFPISGKFTKESKEIYELVLKMQKECIKAMKEGVLWDDVHILAHKIATSGLKDLGILKGDVDELFKERISTAFLPHGLGHYLGMDTHDTGGHPNYQDSDVMFRYLRKRGPLPAGSVITVEPGVYFCRFIIQPFLADPKKSKYIDQSVLDKYWQVGGVRIEDNVVITKDGVTNLTTVPKEVEELEKLISAP